jgi:hypothetical protein
MAPRKISAKHFRETSSFIIIGRPPRAKTAIAGAAGAGHPSPEPSTNVNFRQHP